jgi:hypothetical protein
MKKQTILTYLKISVLADLLLQYSDEVSSQEGELKPRLKELLTTLDADLSIIANAMYEIGDVRRKNTIQEIQNKIDTIFRKSFNELSLIK